MQVIKRSVNVMDESRNSEGKFQVSYNSDNRIVLRCTGENGEELLVCLTYQESRILVRFLDSILPAEEG